MPQRLSRLGRRLAGALTPARLALGGIAAAGILLRLPHNGYGLPYVYNVDEGSHFTSRAVEMFGHDPNPGYFQNPSAFTYLLHLGLRFRHGRLNPFGDYDPLIEQFKLDPSTVYDYTRSITAFVAVAGVLALYYATRRIWGTREALVAAALLCFAFLPVAYGRIAVTDVGTFVPVSLAVLGAVRVLETGQRRWYLLAGAAAGLAIGFKYTAGLVLLPLVVASIARARRERHHISELSIALLVAIAVFVLVNPYVVLDFDDARRQIFSQAETAGQFVKLGQSEDFGPLYYLDSLTWGFGWAAALAALAGGVLEMRRDPVRGLMLAILPLALFLYLSVQSRYFGRWLLPAYPVLAMLAAVAIVRAAAWLEARLEPGVPAGVATRLLAGPAPVVILTGIVLAQPLAADLRTREVLGHPDTRQQARDYLVERFPRRPGQGALRVVIEPAVPGRYYRARGEQGGSDPHRRQFVRGFIRDIGETRMDYGNTLDPRTIDSYRKAGFCVVVTMSTIRGRAENDRVGAAAEYYRRLERESHLLQVFSPYEGGAAAPRFHFDKSYNYYPTAFARPGPEVRIYRLRNCKQGYGPVPPGTGIPEGLLGFGRES